MQLKQTGRLGPALAAATCTLLSGQGAQAAETEQVDVTSLQYREVDRVNVDEEVIALKRKGKDEKRFSLKLYHDTITGASPNGAYFPSDTYTSPSGSSYSSTLAPITDERYAVSADWEREDSRRQKTQYGLAYSIELDYDSLGANWSRSRDSQNRMRTYSYGYGFNYDVIHAEGGNPVGLAPATDTTRSNQDNKLLFDFLGGVSQVLNRQGVFQLNYGLSLSNGYLSDPYKFISIDNDAVVDNLLYEKRPDTRLGHSLYARVIYNIDDNVLKGSYRYYIDDWGILSHTLDMRYRYKLNNDFYLQPHFRHYSQRAADFYSIVFYDAPAASTYEYASADYRLGNLDSLTLGLQAGTRIGKRTDLSLRYEILRQTDRLGEFPSLNASILQLSFRYTAK
ncbi:MAG: DUF3570 domain-containing protein [Gammaproteobacteria bacterium]|nr:DUF3570 domain-containing protein [Gammaproteobacteria bacterium]